MVKEYNRSMGGVELNDMLISLDRVDIQTRKWWYLKMITHCVNICNINAWLLYKRFSDQLDVPKKEQRSLLDFTKEVADVLLSAGKGPKEAAGKKRRSSSVSVCKSFRKKLMVANPVADVRFNGVHHWPEFEDTRNRCRVCSMLSYICCSKCKIHLCLQKDRNCFVAFHK